METEKKPRKQRQPKKVQPVTIDPEPVEPEPTVAEPEPEPDPLPPPKKRGVKKGARMVEYRKNDFRYTKTKVDVTRYKELLEIEKKYNMLVNDIAINNISK